MNYRFNIANTELWLYHCIARNYDGVVKEGLYVHIRDDIYGTFDHVIFNEQMPKDANDLKEIYNRLAYIVTDPEVVNTAVYDDLHPTF